MVGGVSVAGNWEANAAEICHWLLGLAVVNDVALDHEHDMMEFHEDLGAGLMDGRDDCSSIDS